MTRQENPRRRLLLLALMLAALFVSLGGRQSAQALGPCQDQCQQQFNQCRSLGIEYYTCDQQRNYCLYHCQ